MKKIAFALLSTITLTACHESTLQNYNGTKSYNLTENQCSTGEKTFTSQKNEADLLNKYCSALQNNQFNNGCAINLRHETFAAECESQGFTWNPM